MEALVWDSSIVWFGRCHVSVASSIFCWTAEKRIHFVRLGTLFWENKSICRTPTPSTPQARTSGAYEGDRYIGVNTRYASDTYIACHHSEMPVSVPVFFLPSTQHTAVSLLSLPDRNLCLVTVLRQPGLHGSSDLIGEECSWIYYSCSVDASLLAQLSVAYQLPAVVAQNH